MWSATLITNTRNDWEFVIKIKGCRSIIGSHMVVYLFLFCLHTCSYSHSVASRGKWKAKLFFLSSGNGDGKQQLVQRWWKNVESCCCFFLFFSQRLGEGERESARNYHSGGVAFRGKDKTTCLVRQGQHLWSSKYCNSQAGSLFLSKKLEKELRNKRKAKKEKVKIRYSTMLSLLQMHGVCVCVCDQSLTFAQLLSGKVFTRWLDKLNTLHRERNLRNSSAHNPVVLQWTTWSSSRILRPLLVTNEKSRPQKRLSNQRGYQVYSSTFTSILDRCRARSSLSNFLNKTISLLFWGVSFSLGYFYFPSSRVPSTSSIWNRDTLRTSLARASC